MQQQVILLACSTDTNITAWDLNTATQLTQYKNNCSGRNRFCRLGTDYLLAAQSNKDSLHFWALHKDQVFQRSFAQESLTAVSASPSGAYIAAGGASGTLYCWEAATGRLLRSWPAHYKAVSCLCFSDSGGVLVSGGDDTLVCAWLLAEVLDEHRDMPAAAAAVGGNSRVQPLHTWSEHTLPVTSMYLGFGENSALLVTASLDRTIKLWMLTTGRLLRTISLPVGVTAVTLDAGEHVLLAGCVDGSIWEASLVGQQVAVPAAARGAAAAAGVVGGAGSCCYEGHSKMISSLVITPDGEQLVSGSEDGSARVWDLRSRQCLRTINSPNKAPVSTALLISWPGYLAGQHAGQSGGRTGPKRQQPLAPLAKYAASGSSVQPWEGPPMILDGRLSNKFSNRTAAGLLPPPSDPIDALLPSTAAAAALYTTAGLQSTAGPPAAAAGTEVSSQEDVSNLRQLVQQLQQQLQETKQVAEKWQQLHGDLHQFCTDSVLQAAGNAS